jgi:hypothetical protein
MQSLQSVFFKERIVIVEPHPDEKGMGHDFENPSFVDYLEYHVETYLKNGELR